MTGVYMPENTIAYLSLKYDNNEDNVFNFFVSSGAVSDFTKWVSFTDSNTYPFEVTGQLQFTIWGNVFTIIQSKYTGTDMNEEIYLKIMKAQSWMLTNTDSDIIKYNNISDYEIIDTVDREWIIKDITMLQWRKYHTIQLRVDFVTNQTNTIYPKRPYLYDIFYWYEVIENQF